MADFITLACPSCGGKLEITMDIERFACGYCGNEQIVKRSGGIVSLAPVIDEIKKLQTGVDRTSAELAIARLKGEIEELNLAFLFKTKSILGKYESSTERWGLVSDVFIMMLLILDKKDRTKVDFSPRLKDQLINRLYSLSNDDIDFLVYDARKLARSPKAYDKPFFKTFFDELISIKKMREEKDNILRQKEAELERLLRIVNSI